MSWCDMQTVLQSDKISDQELHFVDSLLYLLFKFFIFYCFRLLSVVNKITFHQRITKFVEGPCKGVSLRDIQLPFKKP